MSTFKLSEIENMPQRIAIVTGANNGLGFETTKGLVSKKIKVIMACRNKDKATIAKSNILSVYPNANLEIMELDLTSLESVRAFVASYLAKYHQLDLLINNAGIMIPPFGKTKDGFETQMGVNYFSHFLLTQLLLPLLNKTPNSRVVSLSSIAHKNARIDFNNLNSEHSYSKTSAYGQSKLACLLFAFELDRRLKKANSHVLSVAAHPGVSNTNLFQFAPKIIKALAFLFVPFFTHSPENAALPSLNAALGKDVKGGEFYGPTGFNDMKGSPELAMSSAQSHELKLAEDLWAISEKLTKCTFSL